MRKVLVITPFLLLATQAYAADNIDSLSGFAGNQAAFRSFSEDLSAATSYKALIPAESMGITGFDVGVEVSATSLANKAEFNTACGGCGADKIIIPKVHVHKGLPLGMDVGLMMASVPNSNIKLTGAEFRYAIVEGGMALPAVAARLTYSKLDGVNELDMNTTGLELSVSKGFAMVTPYAGIGQNWVKSTPASSTGLSSEDYTQTKTYVGVNVNLGLMNLAFETDKTGDSSTVSAKFGFRF
jgi:hypothetical protein